MKRLIDKAVLAAVLKRLRKNNEPKENKHYAQFELDVACGYDMALDDIEASIDTLEVKEVDLEEYIDDFISMEHRYVEYETIWINEKDWRDSIKRCAKEFFELGLKALKGE